MDLRVDGDPRTDGFLVTGTFSKAEIDAGGPSNILVQLKTAIVDLLAKEYVNRYGMEVLGKVDQNAVALSMLAHIGKGLARRVGAGR